MHKIDCIRRITYSKNVYKNIKLKKNNNLHIKSSNFNYLNINLIQIICYFMVQLYTVPILIIIFFVFQFGS